jgi:hypothetical protein
MFTRNTKLYKISCVIDKKKTEVYYRDLNTLEYSFLSNIKNEGVKYDIAGRQVIYQLDPDKVPFVVRMKIGEDVLKRINGLLESSQLFEITINEFRESLKKDDAMIAIKNILTYLPGQSFTELLKLNIKDLLELVCLCEYITGKQIFDIGKKHGLINTNKLPDEGKSLQEKMNKISAHLGIPK